MDGMGNMDAPMPPMGADNDMSSDPMGDPMGGGAPGDDQGMMPPAPDNEPPMGGEPGEEPGNEPDPMPGDPNALSAGQDPNGGDDITNDYNQLSPDQKDAAKKYVDSMLNNESKINYRRIIDETFSTIMNDIQKGTKRPNKRLGKEFNGVTDSPFVPNF